MKIVTWNVNGLRGILNKNFYELLQEVSPDILCLQETKVNDDSIPDLGLAPYGFTLFHCGQRRGYSGTAVLSRLTPRSWDLQTAVERSIEPCEGRLMVLDFGKFFLVNVYTPNSGANLRRLSLRRLSWDPEFCALLKKLDAQKPVIACGDFNVAHREIDIAHPDANRGSAGFTDEEREGFSAFLQSGFDDIFRRLHPEAKNAYSWWSLRTSARERNIGWRLDYFLTSTRIFGSVIRCEIFGEVMGSDHAPVLLELR